MVGSDAFRMASIVATEMLRAAVGEIVAGDAGDDDVFESQRPNRLGHAPRLVRVRRQRLALRHAAKPARRVQTSPKIINVAVFCE